MTKQTKAAQKEYQDQYRYHMTNCGTMNSAACKASADWLRSLRVRFQVEIEAEKQGQQVKGW